MTAKYFDGRCSWLYVRLYSVWVSSTPSVLKYKRFWTDEIFSSTTNLEMLFVQIRCTIKVSHIFKNFYILRPREYMFVVFLHVSRVHQWILEPPRYGNSISQCVDDVKAQRVDEKFMLKKWHVLETGIFLIMRNPMCREETKALLNTLQAAKIC